jgi:endonuclease/exonuclease/phosphatase family metal-dependent hydrolase
MLLAYGNLGFYRPDGHGDDVARMRAAGAKVVAVVELRRRLGPGGMHVHQPDRPAGEPGSEAILVDKSVPIESVRGHLSALSTLGYPIGWRRTLTSTVDIPGVDLVAVLVVHMPPLRMRGALYTAYAYRLRRRLAKLNRQGIPWVVAGDFNWLLKNDPAGLRKAFGARWVGERIDGWAVHPDLVPFIRGWSTWDPPHRNDHHPYVYIRLGA